MANELKGTLTKTSSIGSDLRPENIGNFQSVLRDISRENYRKRTKSDKKFSALEGANAKASEVSGGTFKSVMSSLEQMRGGDISKEFTAGVKGYTDTLNALEKKRSEAKKSSGDAMANMTKTLTLIAGFKEAGLDVPDDLYAAIGTRNPDKIAALTPEEMEIQQTLAGSIDQRISEKGKEGDDFKVDPNKWKEIKEAYLLSHQDDLNSSQNFDQKFGNMLSIKERENLGIVIKEKTKFNESSAEFKAAQNIMKGQGKLSDVSTKGNLRSKTASILGNLRDKARESGDIYGVIRGSAGGKGVDATSVQSFEKAANVIFQLGDLGNIVNNEATGPIMGIIRSKNPYDAKAQLIKAQLQAIVPNLARGVYGEVGVLTDADIENYAKTLPNLKSTEDVKNAVMTMTVRSVQRSLENKIKSQASFGRDVSGVEAQYREIQEKADEMQRAFDQSIIKDDVTNADDYLKSFDNPEISNYLNSINL